MTMSSASLTERGDDGAVGEGEDVAARPQRRRSFTAGYKARIVDEYEALEKGSADRGALLRREGLYTSHIWEWRNARERAAGGLKPKSAKKSGKRRTPAEIEGAKLRVTNERLGAELAKTRLALEISGKAHALLELISESADTEPKSKP